MTDFLGQETFVLAVGNRLDECHFSFDMELCKGRHTVILRGSIYV